VTCLIFTVITVADSTTS
jgi:hypothetical protein